MVSYNIDGLVLHSERYHRYIYFFDRNHPLADKDGKVYLHRHVASVKYGKWLSSKDHVHHIDNNRLNNDSNNLIVLSCSEHALLHHPNMTIKKPCLFCGEITQNHKFCSPACKQLASRKVTRPTKEQLEKDIFEMTWLAIGKKYGVSNNAAKKWAKIYKIIQ